MTVKVTSLGWNVENVYESDIILESRAGLTGEFMDFCNAILRWCWENYIEADMVAKWYDDGVTYSAWRITNESDRTMFALRWQ